MINMVVCAQPCLTFATPWTVALQASLPMGFSSKNTGASCHFLLQGDLPNPGTEPMSLTSPALQADSLPLNHWGSPYIWCGLIYTYIFFQILFPCRLLQNTEYTL